MIKEKTVNNKYPCLQKPKNICIMKHHYYPQHTHVRRDAETLSEHGYDVDIICARRKGEKSNELINGVNVYRLPIERHRRGFLRYMYEYLAFFILHSGNYLCCP